MSAIVSFEFSPPKTPTAEETLWTAIRRLAPLKPAFMSVTYGAGGSTRERTHATVKRIHEETTIPPAAHLTCVAASRAEIDEVIRDYWAAGVKHIVALRGDMPGMEGPYRPHPEGYESTPALIAGIRAIAPFEVSVSAYPEKHPDSPTADADLDALKAKVAAGASRAISQFCFVTEAILKLRDRMARSGLKIPLVPGIMPTTNFKGVARMAGKCGASIPPALAARFDGLDEDLETRKLIAAAIAAEQVERLRREGFDQFHFYTLNQADLTYAICRLIGITGARA
ncbi:MAG: methylenetetrahydrofolate reductase [NAD(P)H] [Alphaproteobacteria bacterium]|nr:methylenetetrahydrofolate reductase [NAD(P)H] [Alphaproteobacteria bacterium]